MSSDHRGVGSQVVQDMYFGHLISMDDYKTYGYFSNTHNKIVVVTEAGSQEHNMRDLLTSLHSLVVSVVQNPFQAVGLPITSVRFRDNIKYLVDRLNNANSMNSTHASIRVR
jgi:hypothetical protein